MCAKIPGSSVRDFYHNLDNNQGKEVILKAENNKILKEKKNWILLLFKKLAKLIFNRIFYVAVAMLVQLGWILMMVLRLAAYSRYIDIGLRLIGIVLVLWILNKEINPSYKLAWTMLILILPILGVVLYFVFGRSRIAAIMQQHFEQRIEESREYLRDRPQTRQKLEALNPSASNQSRYISDVSRFPVHENTTAEYFQVGDDMFPVLVRELKQAKKYIFIEYFIIPYLLWFIFIAVTVAYFLIKDKWGFYRLCAFLFSGMTIFLIICTVFPNALNLRPTVFPRDNMFTDMVKVLYKTDTPTNVLPSIHVFNSIGAGIAISHSNDLKKHRWIQISAYILAALIILSTMFLKQHSVTDVIAAVTMACIIYPFVYVTADKKAPKLSQQPT